MSGTAIIGELLGDDAELAALVPPQQTKEGRFPDKTPLPALLLRDVSSVDRQPLKRGVVVRSIDRVSVTVRASSLREQKALIKLVRRACAGKVGSIAGCDRVSVLTAGRGPYQSGPGDSFEQAQDFRVSYDAPA